MLNMPKVTAIDFLPLFAISGLRALCRSGLRQITYQGRLNPGSRSDPKAPAASRARDGHSDVLFAFRNASITFINHALECQAIFI